MKNNFCIQFIFVLFAIFTNIAQGGSIELTPIKDTRILNENPNLAYGNGVLSVYNNGGGNTQHTLITFDFSSIPLGTTITSAVLSLVTINSAGGPWQQTGGEHTDIVALTRNWIANQATWNSWATGNPWTSAGGDFNGNIYASNGDNVFGGGNKLIWNITSLVTEWRTGSLANYGLLMEASVGDTLHFYSSNDPTFSPKLTISFSDSVSVPEPGTAYLVVFPLLIILLLNRRRALAA